MAFTGPCKGCGVPYGGGGHEDGCPVVAGLSVTANQAVGLWMETCAALRLRAERAEERAAEIPGMAEILVEQGARADTAEARLAALSAFVAEIAGRLCEVPQPIRAGNKTCGTCDPCRARALVSPESGGGDTGEAE